MGKVGWSNSGSGLEMEPAGGSETGCGVREDKGTQVRLRGGNIRSGVSEILSHNAYWTPKEIFKLLSTCVS
jgi:hypothetical protein